MLLRLYKSNISIVLFGLPIIALLLWSTSFFQTPFFQVTDLSALNIVAYINQFKILSVITAIFLIVLEAVLLNRIYNQVKFIDKENFLPALFYVLGMCAVPNMLFLNAIHFVNLFLLMALSILFTIKSNEKKAINKTFISGLLIGISSIFYPLAIFNVVIVWCFLLLFKSFNWREWILPVIGALIPWLYIFAYYFMIDEDLIQRLLTSVESSNLIYSSNTYIKYALYGFFGLTMLFSLFFMINTTQHVVIQTRKSVQVLILILLCQLAVYGLSFIIEFDNYGLLFLVLPISFITPYFFYSSKFKKLTVIFFYSGLLLLLFNYYLFLFES